MKAISLTQRLLSIREVLPSGCWKPRKYIEPHGYVRIMVRGKMRYLHDVSYETFVGSVPEGRQLDHTCRNRWCFNPRHLDPVTSIINSLRGTHPLFVAHRESRCTRGHLITEQNSYVRSDGRKRCRECHLSSRRRRRLPPEIAAQVLASEGLVRA